MVKTVCQYLFSSSRNRETNIGDRLKRGPNFEQRERKYAANTWGGGHRAPSKSTQKSILLYIICIHNNLFPLRFHF